MADEKTGRSAEDEAERDTRGAEPPAPPADDAEEQESGPFGNPAEDEEALGNRQQERS